MPILNLKVSFLVPLIITLVISLSFCVKSENILVVAVFSSKSMKNVYEPLIEELANRGHQLIVISPYRASNKNERIRDIIGPDVFDFEDSMKSVSSTAFESRQQGSMMNPFHTSESQFTLCRAFYESPNIQRVLNDKFDLLLVPYSYNECGFGLIHHFGAPFILIHAIAPLPWNNPTGLPHPLAFLPLPFLGFTDRMTFLERSLNFGVAHVIDLVDRVQRLPKIEAIYREFLGKDTPSIQEIAQNVSLVFANSHFSLNFPRPTMPDVIEVGGMHCHPAKELPADLKKFVEESGDNGFILFSMGSILKGHMMPETTRKAFLNAFLKIKQNVLWKWETETMEGLPKNVKLSKWLPQQDILGHQNIRAFITHGGLASVEEAAYHGVPLIGIPMFGPSIGIPIFGDQDSNMKVSEHFGFAVTLEFCNITEENLLHAINSVVDEPIYRNNAKKLSNMFRDRISSPLETAVFHTEYVMRHGGAHHLRSPARHLNFIQYHSLDVIAVLAVTISIVLGVIFVLLRLLFRKFCKIVKRVTPASPLTKTDLKEKLN